MRLEKPNDVAHENANGTACAIYGIDAHPTENLFATAGGDNCVKIWSLEEPHEPEENSIATFELIATLSFHQQAVNCVQWASHGRYLASGSDDQMVLLYERQPGAPAPVAFGSNAKPNKQNWTRCSTLKRHTMDVQDVAWSPDARMLATCSIDNTVLVWGIEYAKVPPVNTQPLFVLSGHSGWVKGLAWDPVGKFLASAGEDKTVRLWQTHSNTKSNLNWSTAAVISKPFSGCASTSHFRRLSWAPDGSSLCATHAFNSQKNIAALLERSTWENDVKFVGHEAVVTSAEFNPRLLVPSQKINANKTKGENDKSNTAFACCAIGGEDATVSIWLAQLARPLAVIKSCFESTVTDLSWSHSGLLLLACSLDGSICCFSFNSDEIGTPMSVVEQKKLLMRKYGARAGLTENSHLVENPLQLQLENEKHEAAVSHSTNFDGNHLNILRQNSAPTVNTLIPKKKSESSDKRRISPMLIKSTSGKMVDSIISNTQNQTDSVTSNFPSSNEDTLPNPKTLDKTASIVENINGESVAKDANNAGEPNTSATRLVSNSDEILKRNRLDDHTVATSTAPHEKDQVLVSNSQSKSKDMKDALVPKKKIKTKHKQSTTDEGSMKPPVTNGLALINSTSQSHIPPQDTRNQSWNLLLPELQLCCNFNVDIGETTIEVKNIGFQEEIQEATVIPRESKYASLCCTQNNGTDVSVKWIDRIAGHVVSIKGNQDYIILATADGRLFVLEAPTGRRIFPSIVLSARVSNLEVCVQSPSHVMVILCDGEVHIWNLSERKEFLHTSIRAIIARANTNEKYTLLKSLVLPTGQPILTFAVTTLGNNETPQSSSRSTMQSYTYDGDMNSWMIVADESFVYSDFFSSLPTPAVQANEIPTGTLRRLQNASGFYRVPKGIASDLFKDLTSVFATMDDALTQRNITRAHLEHQIAASRALASSQEYRYWYITYFKFLVHEEDTDRLELLCADILGSLHNASEIKKNSKFNHWELIALGSTPQEFLKSTLLPILASKRVYQRLVAKVQGMINEIENIS